MDSLIDDTEKKEKKEKGDAVKDEDAAPSGGQHDGEASNSEVHDNPLPNGAQQAKKEQDEKDVKNDVGKEARVAGEKGKLIQEETRQGGKVRPPSSAFLLTIYSSFVWQSAFFMCLSSSLPLSSLTTSLAYVVLF